VRDITKKNKGKPCKAHVLLVDFNDEGQMYRVTIEGNKVAILEYFYGLSSDVRFVKTTTKHRNDKGCRKIPCGTIVACTWECDKMSTFNNYKTRYFDARRIVVAH
jgi:hypothetical protein